MDIELLSLEVLLTINTVLIIGLLIYYLLFFKWDSKKYDDLKENLDTFIDNHYNDFGLHENASNIESLLGRDDS